VFREYEFRPSWGQGGCCFVAGHPLAEWRYQANGLWLSRVLAISFAGRVVIAMEIVWKSVEIEYVTANPAVSYRELADKYGVCLSTVGSHGSAENWLGKREQHREQVANGARTEIAAQQVEWCVEAIEQVDELLDILRDGVHQLTRNAQISDVDKLIRLKSFLLGEPDSRQEVNLNGSARDKLTERLEAYVAQQSSDSDDGGPD